MEAITEVDVGELLDAPLPHATFTATKYAADSPDGTVAAVHDLGVVVVSAHQPPATQVE